MDPRVKPAGDVLNWRSASSQPQRVHAEFLLGVGPHLGRRPAGAARQRAERLDRILIAVLGMNGFAGAEVDALAAHLDTLALQARQMHLDPRALAIEECVVLEA